MTKEDKELLIKDLCARLPYGVKAKYYGSAEECECCDTIEGIYPMDDEVVIGQYGLSADGVKPYLFPLSRLYELNRPDFYNTFTEEVIDINEKTVRFFTLKTYDWLNAHHYDYRGLIEKGLAIDATGLNIY
jgi:hypothetical protein